LIDSIRENEKPESLTRQLRSTSHSDVSPLFPTEAGSY